MKKKYWIITDTHLGHDAMVKYCGRPENHSEIILENIKKMVGEGDVLIHLGDICIGRDEYWHQRLFEAIPKSVSTCLIKGNHDGKSNQWYREHGWDWVLDDMTDEFLGKKVHLSHIPRHYYQGLGFINIHGHWHNSIHRMDPETMAWYDPKQHILVAMENTGLKPVLLEHLLK